MSVTSDYTERQVFCPACNIQPLRIDLRWARWTTHFMPCCGADLTDEQHAQLYRDLRAALAGGRS